MNPKTTPAVLHPLPIAEWQPDGNTSPEGRRSSVRRSDRLGAELVADLESCFLALVNKRAEGWSYNQSRTEVQAFLLHPGLGEMCRLATSRATRHVSRAGDVWLDVFQGALVHLLCKIRRAFETAAEIYLVPEAERCFLGFQRSRSGQPGFAGWMYCILLHACTDECRKLSRYQKRFADSPQALEQYAAREKGSETWEKAARVQEMVGSLPMDEELRTVLIKCLDGKSVPRIAAESNRSLSWVTRKKRKGLSLLLKHFN
jgi:hypothetical protein